MDLRKISNESLDEKLRNAEKTVSEAERAYVFSLEVVSALETEKDRREMKEKASKRPPQVARLIKKWTQKASDMLRASEAMKGDPSSRDSLLQQRDTVLACLLDLESAWDS